MSEEKLRRLAYESRAYQEQMAAMEQQAGAIQATIEEMTMALDTLRGISKNKKPLLVPIGAGVHAKGEVAGGNVLVNVGAGIMVEKPVPEAMTLIEGRIKSTSDLSAKFHKNISDVSARLQQIDSEARKLVEGMKGDVRSSEG